MVQLVCDSQLIMFLEIAAAHFISNKYKCFQKRDNLVLCCTNHYSHHTFAFSQARMLIMAGFPTGTTCALKPVLSHFILLCIGYLFSIPTSNRRFYETCTSGHCMHTCVYIRNNYSYINIGIRSTRAYF